MSPVRQFGKLGPLEAGSYISLLITALGMGGEVEVILC